MKQSENFESTDHPAMAERERHVALRSLDGFLAFGFGSGLMTRAPGTMGTLAAIPFVFPLRLLDGAGFWFALVALFLFGVWLCGRVSSRLGVEDHGGIVWDEMVGYWFAVALVPLHWSWLLAGFVLFRFFDIVKPWPISWVERSSGGGLGIMLDDVAAGLFTLVLLGGLEYVLAAL